MNKTRSLIMIGVAVIVAIIAVVLASRWISKQSSLNTSQVTVATMDVNPGTRLAPNMVKLTEWPAGSVQKDSFNDPKQLENRVTKVSMQRGEAFTESKLAPVGATGGLSAVVAEGKRAMTVRVNDVIGVAGFALPGNYVDILVSTRDDRRASQGQGENDPSISKVVLERILVLAVAQESSQDQTKPKVVNAVTLEVTPEQAEKLDLARSIGQLSLVLRNQVDNQQGVTTGATKSSLLHERAESRAPAQSAASKSEKTRTPASTGKRWCQQIETGTGTITHCY